MNDTFIAELRDIYDAEKQLMKALPQMAKAAAHEDLQAAFESHLDETQEHLTRLENVFELCATKASGKKCKGMQGLIAEGEESIKEMDSDAALICAAQKVEHYEIAAYGSLASWATLLGNKEAANILKETLAEETQADKALTAIAKSTINVAEAEPDLA